MAGVKLYSLFKGTESGEQLSEWRSPAARHVACCVSSMYSLKISDLRSQISD